MSFTDTNQAPGAINRYAVRIIDSDNNVLNSSLGDRDGLRREHARPVRRDSHR